ncbi:type VII secretion target [Mycolicibacterium houstonense]|uniref:type VII secretion target n=1 Tax=Mycolicibacterium houstonense TaxID=146021 RepID=UPI000A4A2B59|nr:type VII secretion target [Mycolicibacterium houstonense]
MPGPLRVDAESLRNTARAQSEVGDFISGMAVGQSLTTAGTGVPGLLSEGACQFAGSTMDTALGAVHEDLTEHATRLSTAAEHYHGMDEASGRRLRKFAP